MTQTLDGEGVEVKQGDVLIALDGSERGVVVYLGTKEGWQNKAGTTINMKLQTRFGSYTVGNTYSKYRHLPRAEHTYEERYYSWLNVAFDYDERDDISKDMQLAIDGILALLPHGINWEDGPWPDSLEGALGQLQYHLTKEKEKE